MKFRKGDIVKVLSGVFDSNDDHDDIHLDGLSVAFLSGRFAEITQPHPAFLSQDEGRWMDIRLLDRGTIHTIRDYAIRHATPEEKLELMLDDAIQKGGEL